MKVLLDTCAFLWWMTSPERVPRRLLERLRDPSNDVLLSAASGWEISVKSTLGRLELPTPVAAFIARAAKEHSLEILPISMAHAVRSGALPLHHRDPFDRLLIAQAEIERMSIATPDRVYRTYGVRVLW